MRLNEDFESTHDLAAWALAYELGDSAVQDRGIVDELSALLQTPVANPGFFCSNLFKSGQKGLMPLVSLLIAFFSGRDELSCLCDKKKKAISQLTSGIMLSWPQINAVQNSRVGHWGL